MDIVWAISFGIPVFIGGAATRYLYEGSWQLTRRKREASGWFKAMLRDQPTYRAPFAGYAAYAIEMGVPSSVAVDLAYSLEHEQDLTLREVDSLIRDEANKW